MNTKGFVLIFLGAMFECGWVYGLKHAINLGAWTATIFCVAMSFLLLILSCRYISASIAYIVYTGLGTLFVVSTEMAQSLFEGVSVDFARIFFVLTLMMGVVGLKGAK